MIRIPIGNGNASIRAVEVSKEIIESNGETYRMVRIEILMGSATHGVDALMTREERVDLAAALLHGCLHKNASSLGWCRECGTNTRE